MTGRDSPGPQGGFSCPVPLSRRSSVTMAHGGGGTIMKRLVDGFVEAFGGVPPGDRHDGAVLEHPGGRIAFTTDSYVVDPLFFPGGDIGSLAVHGTVNDLAVCGARPLWLSAGLIIGEGFPLDSLDRIVASMAGAARRCGVGIVTGDTKVVGHSGCDGIYINTAGIGAVPPGVDVRPANVRPGDAIVISGDIGRHGIAIMCSREGIDLESGIESDSAPIHEMVERIIGSGIPVRCMRDLTRGGLAAALSEIASDSGMDFVLEEASVPVDGRVRAACELLGFDPMHVANEGRFVSFVPGGRADELVRLMESCDSSMKPACIGSVAGKGTGVVTVRNSLGTTRQMPVLSGEQLPRIC